MRVLVRIEGEKVPLRDCIRGRGRSSWVFL